MNFKDYIIFLCVLVSIIIVLTVSFIFLRRSQTKPLPVTENVEVVPTMLDELSSDSAWCPTFELVWKDMVREVVKKDVIFNPQVKMAENLNKSTYNESMLSSEYYYKKYGLKTLELKKEIEKGIKDKFNQTSDILDDFDWSEDALNDPNNPDVNRYFFYTMLYREFKYEHEFSKLDNGMFNNKYEDVEYFGLKSDSSYKVRNQIKVLFYNSKDEFAVLINTKEGDEVILYKNPKGSTFESIYENLNKETKNFKGKEYLQDEDTFKAPIIKFNVKREYTEFQNKKFETANPEYPIAEIMKAIQTIQFELDEKGGKVKSEAGIDIKNEAAMMPDETQIRYFELDSTFALFLREKGKEMPYLGVRIDDITKYQ